MVDGQGVVEKKKEKKKKKMEKFSALDNAHHISKELGIINNRTKQTTNSQEHQ